MLTEVRVRSAKPGEKPYKLFDERGLFLLVTPAGGRLWRFRYRHGGAEKLLSLGAYPDISLKRARERRDEARRLVAEGLDPSAERRAEKAASAHTFESVANEWLAMQAGRIAPRTLEREQYLLTKFIFPSLGSCPIAKLTPLELLSALKRIEASGSNDTAHRARSTCSRVPFRARSNSSQTRASV